MSYWLLAAAPPFRCAAAADIEQLLSLGLPLLLAVLYLTAMGRVYPAGRELLPLSCIACLAAPICTAQVLLVVGREDEVVPADNSRATATRLQRPWLVLLEGGHAAFLQHQPVFLQVLDAFLSS